MSKTNSIVQVNGNQFDGMNGQLISKGASAVKKGVIDGFTLGPQHKTTKAARSAVSSTAKELHKRTQRSATLMRQAVKKPAKSAPLKADIGPVRHRTLKGVRELRAKTIGQHPRVNRFGVLPTAGTDNKVMPAKVKVAAKATYRAEEAAPSSRMPSMVTSVSHKKIEQMLDEALMRADAHKHMMNKNRRARMPKALQTVPRWLSVSLAIVIVIAAAFWLVWQNLPSVAVHVAAARAHVNASVPSYVPSGYKLANPIKYQDGAVTVQFKSSDSQFSITQKTSNWTSSSLANNAVPASSTQTSMVDGTTVYMYGANDDAAWVNHGVMYNLKNDAKLPSDQILKIVQGL